MPDSTIAERAGSEYRGAMQRPKPSRRRVAVWFVLVALILGLVSGAFYLFERKREEGIAAFFANNKPPPTEVAIAEAVPRSVPRGLPGIG